MEPSVLAAAAEHCTVPRFIVYASGCEPVVWGWLEKRFEHPSGPDADPLGQCRPPPPHRSPGR
eukprot:1707923-Pyramimonas_sp.AAC.1